MRLRTSVRKKEPSTRLRRLQQRWSGTGLITSSRACVERVHMLGSHNTVVTCRPAGRGRGRGQAQRPRPTARARAWLSRRQNLSIRSLIWMAVIQRRLWDCG